LGGVLQALTVWSALAAALIVAGASVDARAATESAEVDREEDSLRETVERLEDRVEELEAESDSRAKALADAEARLEANERRARAERLDREAERTAAERVAEWAAALDFRLALAASYNFNFNNPDSDPSAGFPTSTGNRNNGSTFPAVQHNTFQLDQVDLAVGQVATEEKRAGFQLEFLYGVSSDPQNGTDLPTVQQAYASYLAPIGGGIEFKLGRWDTPIGAEVIYVGENFNVTRGLAWFYQTVHRDGLLISGGDLSGWHWKVGVANNGRANNFDNNNGKSGLAQVGWASDDVLVRATYLLEEGPLIGHFSALSTRSSEDLSHFLDLYVHWDLSEETALWWNLDWVHTDFSRVGDTETVLLAIAGRHQLTDRIGLSLRAEGALFLAEEPGIKTEGALWVTKTLDYALTEQLSLRGELIVQHSFAQTPSNILFINGSGSAFSRDTQVIALSQLLFVF